MTGATNTHEKKNELTHMRRKERPTTGITQHPGTTRNFLSLRSD